MATVNEKISNFVKSKLSTLLGKDEQTVQTPKSTPVNVTPTPTLASSFWEGPVGQTLVNLQQGTAFKTPMVEKPSTISEALRNASLELANQFVQKPVTFGQVAAKNIGDIARFGYGVKTGTLAQQPDFQTQQENLQSLGEQAKRVFSVGSSLSGVRYPAIVASQSLFGGALNAIMETPNIISGQTKLSELPTKFGIGAIESFPRGLSVAGVVGPTQPWMDKVTPIMTTKIMQKFGSDSLLATQVVQRANDAVLNILQGIPVNVALEREPVDVQSVIIDGLTGAFLSTSANESLKGRPKEQIKTLQKAIQEQVTPKVPELSIDEGVKNLTKLMKGAGISIEEINGSKVFKGPYGDELKLQDVQNILGSNNLKYADYIKPTKVVGPDFKVEATQGPVDSLAQETGVAQEYLIDTTKRGDLISYEKALDNKNFVEAKKIGDLHPGDARFQVHKTLEMLAKDKLGNAAGALAGIEPEYDENGNFVGVKINPTKAALGVAFMGSVSNTKFDLKDAVDSTKFLQDDTIFKNSVKKATDQINFKTLGEQVLDQQTYDEMMIKGIDLTDSTAKVNKNFLQKFGEWGTNLLAPMKNMPEDLQTAYKNLWAKRMGSTEIATERASKFFNIPEEKGWKIINDIEAGKQTKESKAITQEFDKLYKEAQDAGLDIGYLKNYVTHIWEQSPEEVDRLSRSLGQKFKFSGERSLPTYKEGLAVNEYYGQQIFTPKFTHPSQILGEYVKKLEDTKANIELFKFLKEKKYIVPESVGRELGYQPITTNFFPKSRAVTGLGDVRTSNWYAPDNLSKVINSQFSSTDTPARQFLRFLNKTSGVTQDITLSGGVGPLNFWTIGTMMKQSYTGIGDILTGHPIRGVKTGLITPLKAFFTAFSEPASVKYFDSNKSTLKEMADEGISFSRVGSYSDRFTNTLKEMSLKEKAGKVYHQFFNEPTFKRFMPMMQVELYKDIKNSFLSQGMDNDAAKRMAANTLRHVEGMTNSLADGRDPAIQDAIGAIFFAPRYRESILSFLNETRRSIGLTKDPMKYLGDPSYSRNRSFVVGLAAMYGIYNALNYKLTGHFMHENPAGQELQLQIPMEDGGNAYVPLLPSVFYLPRTAVEATMAVAKGDIAEAKRKVTGVLSQPINLISQVTSNQDYFGNPIYEETDSTADKYKKLGGYMVGNLSHPYLRELIAYQQGRKPAYQAVMNALELPVKFKSAKSEFWNKYFANKTLAEDFKVMVESKDPKAEEFYQKNKQKIDDFMVQKNTLSAYYDAKDGIDAMKEQGVDEGTVKAAEKTLNSFFSPSKGVPTKTLDGTQAEDTYARMYGYDTYLQPKPADELEYRQYVKDVAKDARSVFNNKNIEPSLKQSMIRRMGFDPREIEVDSVSNDTVLERAIWVKKYLANIPQEKQAKALYDLINYETLSGKKVLTSSVAKELGLEGAYKALYVKKSTGTSKKKVTLRKMSEPATIKPTEVGKLPELNPISLSNIMDKISGGITASKPAITEAELKKFRKPL